ncbi:MAG: SPOR domain-containing protein [Hyphomicrobiaceae bacterium]|nr:SPOR domain-containing protein [Hyphomicrobiaceae bacterium]
MAATIAVFMSLATATGIVLMPGQTDREKRSGERLSLAESESRQRDAAATDHARRAPASNVPTASNPSIPNERVVDVAPIRQPLSRSDPESTGNVGVAGSPAQEGRHDILGTQGEAEWISDKAPSASGPDVSPKPANKVLDQGADLSSQPPVQGDVVSEATPADARDLLRPSTGDKALTVTGARWAADVQMANRIPPPARKPRLSLRPSKSEEEGAGRGNERSRKAGGDQDGASPALFVPVLILVKDPAAALEVYSRVRKRHPALLGTKTAEVESVTHDNETWHRVVLRPAATKDAAQSVCQHLGAEGTALGCSVLPVSAH